jgi:enoyl-CoA hydratase/carnithine racemase
MPWAGGVLARSLANPMTLSSKMTDSTRMIRNKVSRAAERIDLVNRAVPRNQLLAAAREMATQIANANQTVVHQMKDLSDLATPNSLSETLRIEQGYVLQVQSQGGRRELANVGDAVIACGRTQASKE